MPSKVGIIEMNFFQYPTQMARCLYKLGEIHGHQKLSYSLLSMNLPPEVQKIMEEYLMYARVFKVEGWDF